MVFGKVVVMATKLDASIIYRGMYSPRVCFASINLKIAHNVTTGRTASANVEPTHE